MTAAVEALHKLAPDDAAVLGNVARVLFDSAIRVREGRLQGLPGEGRGRTSGVRARRALYRLGESAREDGRSRRRGRPLARVRRPRPGQPLPVSSLSPRSTRSRASGRKRSGQGTAARGRPGPERFDLLLEIGDVEFQKLSDRTRRAEDVRRRARGASRRPQAPDEADAALLRGEGLGEARRGRPPPRRLRGGPEAARQVHAHRRHRLRAPARARSTRRSVLRPRHRARPARSRRPSKRPSSSGARRATTRASSGSSSCRSSRPRSRTIARSSTRCSISWGSSTSSS